MHHSWFQVICWRISGPLPVVLLLQRELLWTLMYGLLCGRNFSFLWDRCPGGVDWMVVACLHLFLFLFFLKLPNCFPEWLCYSLFTRPLYPITSTSSPMSDVVVLFAILIDVQWYVTVSLWFEFAFLWWLKLIMLDVFSWACGCVGTVFTVLSGGTFTEQIVFISMRPVDQFPSYGLRPWCRVWKLFPLPSILKIFLPCFFLEPDGFTFYIQVCFPFWVNICWSKVWGLGWPVFFVPCGCQLPQCHLLKRLHTPR